MSILRPAGDFDRTYHHDMSVVRQRWQYILLIGVLAALYLSPWYLSASTVSLINRIGIAIIAVQGLNILTAIPGKSRGQAAFMTVGGDVSTLLVASAGWSFFLALPAAALGAGLVGLLFGLPSLRVKGFYLVMATLSAQFIIPWLPAECLQGRSQWYTGVECASAGHPFARHRPTMFLGTIYNPALGRVNIVFPPLRNSFTSL